VDYKVAKAGTSSYPFILGLDVAGIVEGIGEGVTNWKIGERVCYHGSLWKQGGYAQYSLVPPNVVARIPEEISFEDAAAILCAGMTAYQALYRKITLKSSDVVLVQGGAGGVGGFAIQLACQSGATVITTASTQNHQFVNMLGANYVIDYRQENVKEKVLEITNGRGVDIIVDTISSASATEGLSMLAFGGHLLCIAGLPDFSRIIPFTRALSIHELALGAAHASGDQKAQADLSEMASELLQLLKEKKLNAMVTKTVSLEEVPSALTSLMDRHVVGKIVANKF